MNESISIVNRDNKGRLLPGSKINPKGNNQFTSLVPLLEALEKAGKKRNENFWDMVAQKVWSNETVLIAVLKKILPDKLAGEGFGNQVIINNIKQILESACKNGDRLKGSPSSPELLEK